MRREFGAVRFLLFRTVDPRTGYDLWVLPFSGDKKPFPFLKTPFEERNGQFSHDGKWVAYQSNESGRFEIYVQPFPGPGGKSGCGRGVDGIPTRPLQSFQSGRPELQFGRSECNAAGPQWT